MEKDRISILSLQNRAMNETLQKCKDETREEIQDVKLQSIEYQLELLRNQVSSLGLSPECSHLLRLASLWRCFFVAFIPIFYQ